MFGKRVSVTRFQNMMTEMFMEVSLYNLLGQVV